MGVISLIAAVSVDGCIGGDNKMLWNIPEDLEFYKIMTTGNIVVVGNSTYVSLPRVALQNRKHIVITRKKNLQNYNIDNSSYVHFVNSTKIAIKEFKKTINNNDVFIAGGQSIYEQLFDFCEFAYITWVDCKFKDKADKFFPLDKLYNNYSLFSESEWNYTRRKLPYKYCVYRKLK